MICSERQFSSSYCATVEQALDLKSETLDFSPGLTINGFLKSQRCLQLKMVTISILHGSLEDRMTNREGTLKNHYLLYKSKALSLFLGSRDKSVHLCILTFSKK